MKKALSFILALVMVIGLMPMAVFAAEGTAHTTVGITLGDFSVAGVGKTALTKSDVLLSQKTLIAVPYLGAALHIAVNDGYMVRIHSGDNNNNINQASDWLKDGDTYTLPTASIYMRVSIRRVDGGKITLSDLDTACVVVSYESSSNIVTDNADAVQILKNSDLPVLIHLSDIHGDTIRAERAASFADFIGADALLASGDLTANQPDDWGTALFDSIAKYSNISFIYGIGNHDAQISATSYQQTIYNSYFGNNPRTPNGETYYYQDLADQKLRVISVNQQEGASTTTSGGTCYSQAQVDWLVETLQNTPAGFGVVLMYHSPETAIANAGDPNYTEFFQNGNRYDNPTNNYSGYSGTFLMDLVDAFMMRKRFTWNYSEKNGASSVTLNADFTAVAEGVEFIAHVTGHVHSDSVTYLPGTACKQLLLGVTCTNSMYGEPGGYYGLADYSDLNRVGNTSSQDAFNAYIIDRESKTVRILRIGAKQTTSGNTRDDMTIAYSVPFEVGEYLFDTEGLTKLDMSDVEWVNYGIQPHGTEPSYLPGIRWSSNAVFDVPYEGVTFYIKINAPYEAGIRSGATDTTMDTNYYWLNNKELSSGDKNRGYAYTIPAGHTKFIVSLANVSRDGSNKVTAYTDKNLITSLELEAAGLEIWYAPNHPSESPYPFETAGKAKVDMSDVEWVNYGIQAYGKEPEYLPGVRLSPDMIFDVPYDSATFYIKINAPYEVGIRSGSTDTTMDTNHYWLNNKFLSGGDSNRGYVYTIPAGHTKYTFSVANTTRNSAGNVTNSKNPITLAELEAVGLEIWYVPCKHTYENGICAGCGAEEPHSHSYKSAITAPTCAEAGYTTYTCECGDSYVDDYVDATGHTYENGICTGCGSSVLDGNYTHAVPENQGVQNAIDRAYSLTDVEWTPLANVPGVKKINGEFTVVPFEAGKTYRGIPYSGVTANDCYVGLNVSLESFLTALENENSVLYTENLFSTNPKSAAYFGTVCSKFAQYALDVPGSYNTNNIANIPGMETIALPGKYTVDQIKLGDVVLHTQDHTTVCTDILYDADGNVAFIEISEAVLPLCRRMYWSPEEFYEHFDGYRLCRYQYIGQTPAINETKLADNYALMPRFGDKYNYKVSSTKGVVDVLESGYHKAVILRDGVVIDEIILGGATAFKFDRSVPGYLEMYLEKQDGTRSGSVYAWVVKSSVTVTNTSRFTQGNLTVTIDGSCGTPVYVQVGSAHAIFCNVAGKSGTVEISFPFSKVSSKQVRVAYQNEYGIYLSDWSWFTTASNTSQDAYLSQGGYWDGYTLTPSSHTPVIQSGKTSYWTYTTIPVEENTTYYSKGCNRMWFLDAKGNPISTFNANTESDVRFQFTTPVGTAYVSITYAPSGVDKGTETLVHVHTYEDGTCIECGHRNGPVITQQPTHAEVKLGERYCITAEAEGEALGYQWYFRDAGAESFSLSPVTGNIYSGVMTEESADREVYCVITDAYGNSVNTDTVTLKLATLPGDLNGDGKLNNKDATRLMQYLAGWDVDAAVPPDINGDGKLNNKDVTRLMQYLAGWDVEIH